ncbi:MAG: flagellar motor protein MotA [Rickettsiales bacterium]|nr:flagellar motor protein MotA [Rickettsiales bacterium]RPG14231.1 MAG: flagellar motor protein MotA [Pelagibacteraceae bacterium TMED195]|tara:strand:- start:7013 stop:7951 length:939 start_codon:yes stop_codon:yes gene_type:complete
MKIIGKYILRILMFLILVSATLFFYIDDLKIFFFTNQTLNSIILIVIFCGIIYVLRQLFILVNELNWLNHLLKGNKTKLSVKSPNLLKYLDTFLREQSGSLIFSQSSMKSIMESLDGRLSENREISRYLIGLSVFLGLLGTFWGLLETINSVAITVKSLDFSENTQKLFQVLKQGLEEPLSGMGTAFSSSLFGLGGSLILGFLDIQSGQAQNRFYNEIEEKLSQKTKFTLINMDESERKNLPPAYLESLIEVTTENLKKSTSVIDKQNIHQESISKSIYEVNKFLSENISLNNDIKEEIKVLSKTIANISKK